MKTWASRGVPAPAIPPSPRPGPAALTGVTCAGNFENWDGNRALKKKKKKEGVEMTEHEKRLSVCS